MKLHKLLVPVDFSKCSRAAFNYSKLIAKKFSANIYLLHVVDKRHVEKIAEVNGESEDELSKKLSLQAKQNLERFLANNGSEGLIVEKIITVGIPFHAIALKAQALGTDMIVMGGHGRVGNGQIDKIFFGSAAERVVRLLPCPVLCVPQEDVDTEIGEKEKL
ncbi:MAG: universal stress protein [Deltaproteobacteria bacterium]|nr:universal stress protein [Deltaproteobacteria bacterium]